MVINGQDYPVVSSDYTMKGKGRGTNTAEKVGGGAALGAIIGAIAGGGRGAAIGAGAGSAAGAGVQRRHARPTGQSPERNAARIPPPTARHRNGSEAKKAQKPISPHPSTVADFAAFPPNTILRPLLLATKLPQ